MNASHVKNICRTHLNEYLRKALSFVQESENMTVLDIGCGTGVSVLEIARNTNWRITAVDPNQDNLDVLKETVQQLHYTERISIIQDSIETLKLPEKSFDMILAEGLFNIIGFQKGLLLASKYLKDKGFIIIHDELEENEWKLKLFEENNFYLIASFILDEKVWWEKYFYCVEKQLNNIKELNQKDFDFQEMFKCEIAEIEMYKKDPSKNKSIYYIVQKGKHREKGLKSIERRDCI